MTPHVFTYTFTCGDCETSWQVRGRWEPILGNLDSFRFIPADGGLYGERDCPACGGFNTRDMDRRDRYLDLPDY